MKSDAELLREVLAHTHTPSHQGALERVIAAMECTGAVYRGKLTDELMATIQKHKDENAPQLERMRNVRLYPKDSMFADHPIPAWLTDEDAPK